MEHALSAIGQILRIKGDRLAVIIDHAESLIPKRAFQSLVAEKLSNLETLREFAFDSAIHETANMLILMTERRDDLEEMLFQGGAYEHVNVPPPDKGTRKAFLEYLDRQPEDKYRHLVPLSGEDFPEGLEMLAGALAGFTLRSIDAFNSRTSVRRHQLKAIGRPESEWPVISKDRLMVHRRRVLINDSEGILKEVKPRGSFDAVGNLENIKRYFKTVAEALRRKRLGSVPKAVILAGPPGTGKSILAEALANEAGIPMVKMGSVYDKYVGESERRMEKVLDLLLQMEPVIVFIDEIDQMIGQRVEQTGGGGATRTEARLFGRMLEFMGDDKNRGRVLWIGATNRPDKLDDAMLRRFDRRFPVLMPYSVESRTKILEAFGKGTVPGLSYGSDIDLREVAKKMNGYSGSEMEQIIRNAIGLQESKEGSCGLLKKQYIEEAIESFIASRDQLMYDFQTLLSVDMCNNADDLPEPESLPDTLGGLSFKEIVKNLKEEGRDKKNEAKRLLRERIDELRTRLLLSK